jgi:phage terminase small subunit
MPDLIPYGDAGQALWDRVVSGLPEGFALTESEEAILGLAACQADDLGNLEATITKHGTMVTGSKGQPVLNPAVAEARQARLAIGRLLGQIPEAIDDGAETSTAAKEKARKAAQARWRRERAKEVR